MPDNKISFLVTVVLITWWTKAASISKQEDYLYENEDLDNEYEDADTYSDKWQDQWKEQKRWQPGDTGININDPYMNIMAGNTKEWTNFDHSHALKRSDNPLPNPPLEDLGLNMSNPLTKYHCPVNLLYGNNLTVKNFFLLMPRCNMSTNVTRETIKTIENQEGLEDNLITIPPLTQNDNGPITVNPSITIPQTLSSTEEISSTNKGEDTTKIEDGGLNTHDGITNPPASESSGSVTSIGESTGLVSENGETTGSINGNGEATESVIMNEEKSASVSSNGETTGTLSSNGETTGSVTETTGSSSSNGEPTGSLSVDGESTSSVISNGEVTGSVTDNSGTTVLVHSSEETTCLSLRELKTHTVSAGTSNGGGTSSIKGHGEMTGSVTVWETTETVKGDETSEIIPEKTTLLIEYTTVSVTTKTTPTPTTLDVNNEVLRTIDKYCETFSKTTSGGDIPATIPVSKHKPAAFELLNDISKVKQLSDRTYLQKPKRAVRNKNPRKYFNYLRNPFV